MELPLRAVFHGETVGLALGNGLSLGKSVA
jgi:hypothetical protein